MGSALVVLSPEGMPIICNLIVHSVNIIVYHFVPSIILSTADASENVFPNVKERNLVHGERRSAPGS